MSSCAPKPLTNVFIDLELTGLDTELDQVVEFGIIGTTEDLTVLFERKIVVEPTKEGFARIRSNRIVRQMATDNGLLAELEDGYRTGTLPGIHQAERQIIELLTPYLTGEKLILSGSGVHHCDFRFLKHHTPTLAKLFDNRELLDVGMMRRAYKRATGADLSEANGGKNHRADTDIRCSLQETRSFFAMFKQHEARRAQADTNTAFVSDLDDMMQMIASMEHRDAGDPETADSLASGLSTERQMHALANITRILASLLGASNSSDPTNVYAGVRRTVMAQMARPAA